MQDKLNDTIIAELGRKRGVRQQCPLSPTRFYVVFSDLEPESGKEKEGSLIGGGS